MRLGGQPRVLYDPYDRQRREARVPEPVAALALRRRVVLVLRVPRPSEVAEGGTHVAGLAGEPGGRDTEET